jgi:hypothetical protein
MPPEMEKPPLGDGISDGSTLRSTRDREGHADNAPEQLTDGYGSPQGPFPTLGRPLGRVWFAPVMGRSIGASAWGAIACLRRTRYAPRPQAAPADGAFWYCPYLSPCVLI